MFTCKEIAEKSMSNQPLTLREKFNFHLHLFICKTCRVFVQQMENLDSSMKKVLRKRQEGHHSEARDLQEEILKLAQKRFPKD